MRMRIRDEFTELPISRQRKYQWRMQRDRRCTECGEPAALGSRCLKLEAMAAGEWIGPGRDFSEVSWHGLCLFSSM